VHIFIRIYVYIIKSRIKFIKLYKYPFLYRLEKKWLSKWEFYSWWNWAFNRKSTLTILSGTIARYLSL